jgi:hypothetical protein
LLCFTGYARRCGLRRCSPEPGARAAGKSARPRHPQTLAAALGGRAAPGCGRTYRADRHGERRLAGCTCGSPLCGRDDRAYADGGHSLDFINKSFECLDLIGWEHAADVLLSVVGQMAAARGAGERTAWRQPVDLIALCQRAGLEFPHLFAASDNARGWSDHATLSESLLGDDPVVITDALTAVARDGAAPADLGQALAYAAALRAAWFGTANEHSDWETAHHVLMRSHTSFNASTSLTSRQHKARETPKPSRRTSGRYTLGRQPGPFGAERG